MASTPSRDGALCDDLQQRHAARDIEDQEYAWQKRNGLLPNIDKQRMAENVKVLWADTKHWVREIITNSPDKATFLDDLQIDYDQLMRWYSGVSVSYEVTTNLRTRIAVLRNRQPRPQPSDQQSPQSGVLPLIAPVAASVACVPQSAAAYVPCAARDVPPAANDGPVPRTKKAVRAMAKQALHMELVHRTSGTVDEGGGRYTMHGAAVQDSQSPLDAGPCAARNAPRAAKNGHAPRTKKYSQTPCIPGRYTLSQIALLGPAVGTPRSAASFIPEIVD